MQLFPYKEIFFFPLEVIWHILLQYEILEWLETNLRKVVLTFKHH